MLRGLDDARYGFVVLTYWTDLDAVEAFSGPDPRAAVVPAEARALLAEYDRVVEHLEVALESV